MNYGNADAQLTGRCSQGRKLANNTYLERRGEGVIAVRLHSTDVVTLHKDGRVILESGGWRTVTTKDRMQNFSSLCVYSEKGVWYVAPSYAAGDRANAVAYADGITYNTATGEWSGVGEDPRAQLRLRRQIAKFCKAYMAKFAAYEIPAPGPGDCWFCLMFAKAANDSGRPDFGSADHLLDHMRESYFVPSLLARAVERFPVSRAAQHTLACHWSADATAEDRKGNPWGGIATEQLGKSLRRYMCERLGTAA
jgi:hypothetical protein